MSSAYLTLIILRPLIENDVLFQFYVLSSRNSEERSGDRAQLCITRYKHRFKLKVPLVMGLGGALALLLTIYLHNFVYININNLHHPTVRIMFVDL